MIKEAINMLINNISLTEPESAACMQEIMEGKATDAQIGAFLAALRMKGETVEEITGAARIMRQKAAAIQCTRGGPRHMRDRRRYGAHIQYLYDNSFCCCRSRCPGRKTRKQVCLKPGQAVLTSSRPLASK